MSTGAPGRDTANGTYLTIEKGNPVLMSGSSFVSPDTLPPATATPPLETPRRHNARAR